MAFSKLPILGFAVVLTLAALRAYQFPAYTSDGFLYMANAVAMHGGKAPEIHATVYREAYAGVPRNILDHLLGKDPVETPQSLSFHEREVDPYRFTEFLPCFAVRPIFNELVYVLHYWFGISLLRSTVLIPVISYWLLGWVVLLWMSRYAPAAGAALASSLFILTPPIWELARSPMPDALSCLTILLALYLILEKNQLLPGLSLLLASVYVRTDNMLLALTALGYLSVLKHAIDKSKAAVLALVAVGSVLLINHYAGDYGAKLLYYRAFVSTPLAPGELVPHFGLHDYLAGLRAGVATILHGDFFTFGLMGVVALLRRPGRALVDLAVVTVVYGVGRFLIFPLGDARYFGLFFLAMGIMLASVLVSAPSTSSSSGPNLEMSVAGPSQPASSVG